MVAIRTLPPDLHELARRIDQLGDGNEDVTPHELESARPTISAEEAHRTPEARAAIRRLTEHLIPTPAIPAPDSGEDIDDAVRPRTIGRRGLYQSELHPAEGGVRREVVTFMTPQNPAGLKLEPGQPVPIPRQLISGSVIAANVQLDNNALAVVRTIMEGKDVPRWSGTRTPELVPYYGEMKLESDAPCVVKSIEIIYSPHWNQPTPDKSGDLSRLNDTQRAVLEDVKAKAKARSDAAREALVQKAERLGYSERELDLALHYIATVAPIVIHIDPDKSLAMRVYGRREDEYRVPVERNRILIDAFLADTNYRNQFETGLTSGSATAYEGGARDTWEKTIFEGGYHGHPLVPEERPKYGAMNPSWRPFGPAVSYGECYLIMKRGIRNRTTFTPGDSSSCRAETVGTAQDFQHVLNATNDSRFKAILDVALGYDAPNDSNYPYLEAQIHGPVEFAQDVERLVIDTQHKGTEIETKLRAWAEANGFAVSWHDRKEIHVDGDPIV